MTRIIQMCDEQVIGGTTLGVWIVSTRECAKKRILVNVLSSSTRTRESVVKNDDGRKMSILWTKSTD